MAKRAGGKIRGFDWDKGRLYGEEDDLPIRQKRIRDEIRQKLSGRRAKPSEGSSETEPVIQQSDVFKPFLVDIGNYGLNYAYNKYQPLTLSDDTAVGDPCEEFKQTQTEHPIDVLVIGAGMSGLSAAYELAQVGHNVTILEMQHRVGGRIKTLSESHFYKGLWADSGAMRLPGTGDVPIDGNNPTDEPSHFMTDFYAQKFQIPIIPFVNSGSNGFYKFYGEKKIRMRKWNKDKKGHCNRFWPGWDSNVPEPLKSQEDFDIGAYYGATVAPVRKQLEAFLDENSNTAWERWLDMWTRISVDSFFRTSYEGIILKLRQSSFWKDEFQKDLYALSTLLPWPQEAVTAFYTSSYVPSTGMTIADFLRDELGQWWTDPMHVFEGGMKALPENFVLQNTNGWNTNVKLSNNIIFGQVAYKITYTPTNVVVSCRNLTTMEKRHFTADRVVITLPINVLRGLTFSPPLPHEYYKAFESISVEASTKVMIQTRTRFWENGPEHKRIQGGFTKTNMPISQIHYPSNPGFAIPSTERGILMCYTWKNEALLFGSQTQQNAIAEVVEQLAEIHPQITTEFEVGAIQSWYDDPSAQGAFVLANTDEYDDIKLLLKQPHETLYFCGEALSFTNGWIQGALESALIAAFQLYSDNEDLYSEDLQVHP